MSIKKKIFALFLSFTIILSGVQVGNIAYGAETDDTSASVAPAGTKTALLDSCSLEGRYNTSSFPGGIQISPNFNSEIFEYEVVVTPPLRTNSVSTGIEFGVSSKIEEATITAKYKNASTGKEETKQPNNGSVKIPCVNADKASFPDGNNVVITVTPPEGSELEAGQYTFNVKLANEDRLIGIKYGDTCDKIQKSIVNPTSFKVEDFDKYYNCSLDVNENQKTIAFEFYTADNNTEISVNREGNIIQSFPNPTNPNYPKYVYVHTTPTYSLNYGTNVFMVKTKIKGSNGEGKTYTITVNRARPLLTCNFSVEDGDIIRNSLVSEGFNNTIDGYTYAATGSKKTFKLYANAAEDCIVTYDIPATRENAGKYENKVIGNEGLELNRPTYERNGSKDYYDRLKMSPTTVKIYVTKQDEENGDVYDEYVVNIYARMPDGASRVSSAQSAPGQFANSTYGNIVDSTLLADINTDNLYNIHSLGTFGGSITYAFDEPITNDPNNKYGVDFVVYGNSFGSGAAEAAAVSVSKDGNTWYNLAGSEYYELTTDWNYSVTYNKGIENGISTKLASFTSSNGAENWLKFRSDMYWPMNSRHVVIGGTELGESYTLTGVCTYDGSGKKPVHAFGYADVSPNGNVDPTSIQVDNPYVEGAQYMDLSWAVDKDGKPVQLNEVNYVKVTNCVLYFSEAFGESSTEVGGITKVNASVMKNSVGVTKEPASIMINGVEYKDADFTTLNNGQQKYLAVDLNDISVVSLDVNVKGAADDNIWINNQRSEGQAERTMILDSNTENLGNRMVRIIVQNGNKEPLIYVFDFTGGGNSAVNADLDEVVITPGDIAYSGTDFQDGIISCEVENNVEKIAFTARTLNPSSGMTLKTPSNQGGVKLENGTICDPISLAEGENTFAILVTSTDHSSSKEYKIKVTRKTKQETSNSDIRVTFSFTGDVKHGCDADGNPNPGHVKTPWIPSTTVEIPKGSTVKYLTDMMLYNSGIAFDDTDGTYISKVQIPGSSNWLGEFDNGKNSGWMYRHNTLIADVGYAARVLSDGDTVEWFYTDDYTKETGFESGNWDISADEQPATEVTTTGASGSAVTTTPTEVTVSGDVAAATVKAEHVTELLKQAQENKSEEIVMQVSPSASKGAETVKLQLDASAVSSMIEKTTAVVTASTENGTVTLDREILKQAVSEAGGKAITLEIVKPKTVTAEQRKAAGESAQFIQAALKSGDKTISTFDQGKATVRVEVPENLQDKKIAAVSIREDGTLEVLNGKTLTEGGKTYYQFTVSSFGTFALVDADEAGVEVPLDPMPEEVKEKLIAGVRATTIKAGSSLNQTSIKLTWTKSKGYKVDGYQIYRSTKKSSGYKKYATTKKLTYTNRAGLKKGTRYYYKVRGYREIDGKTYYTQWSNKAYRLMKTNSVDYGVKKTTVKAGAVAAKGSIKVTWTKSKGYKVDGYEVYRSTSKTKNFKKLGATAKTTYKNTKSLKKGTAYYYKVRGYRVLDGRKYYTKWSSVIKVKAK